MELSLDLESGNVYKIHLLYNNGSNVQKKKTVVIEFLPEFKPHEPVVSLIQDLTTKE